MINWPAVIKHTGDAELTYIRDQKQWDNETELDFFEYDVNDYLIDSSGNIFNFIYHENNYQPESNGKVMELSKIVDFIKAHAAQKGVCCVSKLYPPSIAKAFEIVESINET